MLKRALRMSKLFVVSWISIIAAKGIMRDRSSSPSHSKILTTNRRYLSSTTRTYGLRHPIPYDYHHLPSRPTSPMKSSISQFCSSVPTSICFTYTTRYLWIPASRMLRIYFVAASSSCPPLISLNHKTSMGLDISF